jgi:hypothetical protein
VKKLLVFFFLMLAISSLMAQEFYIKTKYNWGQAIFFSETWVGDGKMAIIAPGQTTIVDLNEKVVYQVFHKKKFYVQAAFPFGPGLEKLSPVRELGSSLASTLQVLPSGESKIIAGKACTEYDLVRITKVKSDRSSSVHMRVYATTDIPLNMKKYTEALQEFIFRMQWSGLDDSELKELGKIKGFQMSNESTVDIDGHKIHSSNEVLEITEKSAPAGIYTVPEGYKKRKNVSLQDMR